MNFQWLRKHLGFLAFSGISLILVGSIFSPFLKYPPGKDSNGYYLVTQRTKERIYSDEAKETYIRYWGCNLGAVTGIGLVVSIPIIIVFDRIRKRQLVDRDRDAPRGAPLPHHHSYGSVSGGSADPKQDQDQGITRPSDLK
jgi:hypothetical protein